MFLKFQSKLNDFYIFDKSFLRNIFHEIHQDYTQYNIIFRTYIIYIAF
jgi:hypothetical protein